MRINDLFLEAPVNVSINIYVNSFGSIAETTMVSCKILRELSLFNLSISAVSVCFG